MELTKIVRELGPGDNGEIFTLKRRLELPEKELVHLQAKFTLDRYNLFAASLKGSSDLVLLCDGRHPASFTTLIPGLNLEHKIVGNCGSGKWTLKHIPWFDDANKRITALSFDEDGTLYIGLQNGTIYELNAMAIVASVEPLNDIDLHHLFQLDELQILDILIWFKGNSKVILCNGGNGKFLLLPANSLPTLVTFNSPIRSMELYIGGTNLACALICLDNGQNATTILDDLDLPPPGESLVKKSLFRRAKENIISRFGDTEKGIFGRKSKETSPTSANVVTNTESVISPLHSQQDNGGSGNVVSIVTKLAQPTNIKVTNLEDVLCRGEMRKIVGKNQFFRHKENKLDIFDNDFRQVSSVYIPTYINKLFIIHKIFYGVDEENKCLRISLVHNAMLKEFAVIHIQSKVLFIEPAGDAEITPYSIFVTTENEIYQMVLTKSPVDICVDLLMKDSVSALLDVVCLALNVPKNDAFIAAGDKCSQEGKYAKTIIYYKLAGMNHPKIIAKFGSRGLIPAMIYFSELVDEEKHRFVGTLRDKSFMANIVIFGKIEQFVRYGERSYANSDPKHLLRYYLKHNLYYTSKVVAMSLCYPELFWALEVVAETRLCYPDILLGLYHNREMIDHCFHKGSKMYERFWSIICSDWMALYATSSEVFIWFRNVVLKNLGDLENDMLYKLVLCLLPWRRELQGKVFADHDHVDLTEVIDFTVAQDGPKVIVNDYVELFLTLVLEALKRKEKEALPMRLPNFVRANHIVTSRKKSSSSHPTANIVAQVLLHAKFNTLLSASLHECACVRNEKAYTWGEAKFGRLGVRDESSKPRTNIDIPTPVALLPQLKLSVRAITCGQAHNMALTSIGTILVWGSNTYGQLGLGQKTAFTGRPFSLNLPNFTFTSISAGGYHSVAVDQDGNVFTWGWGVFGQLGNGSIENRYRPVKIHIEASFGKVIVASAGHCHTALLTNTGKVLTFGCSHFGQLGHGTTSKRTRPKLLEGLPSGAVAKFITCGVSGTALVTMKNRLFYCGLNPSSLKSLLNSSRRNGKPSATDSLEEKDFVSPTLIESSHLNGEITKVSVATTHLGVLTTSGYVYTYGVGKSGQLVRPDDENKTLELIDCDDRIILASDVVCAGDCTFFIERDTGKLYGCGFNSSGQLGKMECDEETSILTIRTKKRIVKVRQPANIYFRPREILGLPREFAGDKHETPALKMFETPPPCNFVSQELLEWSFELLIRKYNHKHVKKLCLQYGNSKAASVIDKLHEQYESALKHELADIHHADKSGEVISNYADDVEKRNGTCLPQICTFLTIVITHWRKKDLPGDHLERILDELRQRPNWKKGLGFAVKDTMTLNEGTNAGNESAEWMAANFTPAFILSCFKDGQNVPLDLLSNKINLLEPDSFCLDEFDEITPIDT